MIIGELCKGNEKYRPQCEIMSPRTLQGFVPGHPRTLQGFRGRGCRDPRTAELVRIFQKGIQESTDD